MLSTKSVAPMAVLAFLVACTDANKIPADTAIKGAEAALTAVRTEAAKYVPDQLKAVEDGLAKAKDAYAKSDFKGALAAAKDLPGRIQELATAAAAKKTELTKSVQDALADLPKLLEDIKARVDTLSAGKKLPKGIDAAKLASAKEKLASLTQAFEDASAKLKAGTLPEALAAATPLKDKAAEIAASIGLTSPAAPAR